MNRLRRATIVASFAYLQYGLAIVSGIVMVPLLVRALGTRTYGLWLASGELLGYAAMVDLGVIGVLPWMLAEADGRRDREGMRRLIVNGLVLGAAVGLTYGLLAAVLWLVLPSALSLSAADRALVGPPLALLVVTLMLAYPLRVFSAVLVGVQDVTFNGWLAVVQGLVNIVVSAALLWNGAGLFAPALGTAAATMVSVGAAGLRARAVAPDLVRGWPRPSWPMVRSLLTNGLGVWGGTFGWQLVAASNGLVMAALGRPEWMAIYACSAKLTGIATQLAWVVPDAGLVGLAQVHGESPRPERLRPLVLLMLRLHLLLAGGAACVLLVANPAFVMRWVGADLFGGLALNGLLALGIIAASLVHGLLTAASVIGNRPRAGAVTLAQGALQVAAAWLLGRAWGLPGVALAALSSGLLISLTAGTRLLTPATGLTLGPLTRDLLWPWSRRVIPVLLLAAWLGRLATPAGLPVAVVLSALVAVTYAVQVRPMLAGLPLDSRLGGWLVRLHLVPAGDAGGRMEARPRGLAKPHAAVVSMPGGRV